MILKQTKDFLLCHQGRHYGPSYRGLIAFSFAKHSQKKKKKKWCQTNDADVPHFVCGGLEL